MNSNSDFQDFISLSQAIGAEEFSIQGGGGNTSVKLNSEMMAIKASGYRLRDLSLTSGVSFVALRKIQQFILQCSTETLSDLDSNIQSQVIQYQNLPILRPSIETGFHSLFDQFVVHTHSVYANVLNCCVEGQGLLKKILPDAVWVDYFTPGAPLTLALRDIQKNKKSHIYFLANHGVILTHPTSAGVRTLHHEMTQKIQQALSFDPYMPSQDVNLNIEHIRKHVLFPDQIVYTLSDETMTSVAAKETLFAYQYIVQTLLKNNLTARYLDSQEVQRIHEMESEKYRKKMII